MKIFYKKNIILGFLFFSISMAWSVYNTYVPIFLKRIFEDNNIIGLIMSLGGFAGMFLYPTFGVLSDRTRNSFGKRMPYIMYGMSTAAVITGFIPSHWNLASLILFIIGFNVAMISIKGSGLAYMADLVPDCQRSISNGIIKFFVGIGALAVYLFGSCLYCINENYPFLMAFSIIVISNIILYKYIHGSEEILRVSNEVEKQEGIEELIDDEETVREVLNILFLLGSVFFLFFAFKGVESYLIIYMNYHLGIGEIEAMNVFTYFSLSMVAFAVPSGFLSRLTGRKWAILMGLLSIFLVFIGLKYFGNTKNLAVLSASAGASFALININFYPLIVSMAKSQDVGRFTGYYYMCICLATIISPPILYKLIDIFGYSIFLDYVVSSLLLSIILMIAFKPQEEKLYKWGTNEEHVQLRL